MSYWHKSTELPEYPVVPCLIAVPPSQDCEFWTLHSLLHCWHESEGCWVSMANESRLYPGDDFRWGYEIELFAELEHEDEEEAAHV